MSTLRDRLQHAVPRCLAGVAAERAPLVNDLGAESTAFTLRQLKTGDGAAQILGYPLEPEAADASEPPFISPLTLRWSDKTKAKLFDSDKHGYHAQLESSAKLRGKGTPTVFCCGRCGADRFIVRVQFDYWDGCADLLEEEPDIAIQDWFQGIVVAGTCLACRETTEVLGMDL